MFHLRNFNSEGGAHYTVTYGRVGDEVLIGDWDGNGTDTLGIRRVHEFHLRNDLTSGPAHDVFKYGRDDDEVFFGDRDGDGTDTIAVRRGNTFYVKNSLDGGPADITFPYGKPGDTVLVGDWDIDGIDTFAVKRGKEWLIRNDFQEGNAELSILYGRDGDHSLVGDWNGDGIDTPGVFRGGPPLKAACECAPLNDGRSRYTTGNANRVSLVIAERYGTSYATFVNCHKQWDGSYYEEWQTPTRIGLNGMARVGEPAAWHTHKTPTGSYSVTESFGVYDPGAALDYRQLNSRSEWGGTRGVNYNQYFEGPKASSADEDMWAFANRGNYRLGVVINHNRPPDSQIVEGMGYGIFLLARKVGTAGCVALTENEVAMYMGTAQKGDRFIMGVRSHIFTS